MRFVTSSFVLGWFSMDLFMYACIHVCACVCVCTRVRVYVRTYVCVHIEELYVLQCDYCLLDDMTTAMSISS